MPRLPDAEVTILVDGVPLPEYKTEFTGEHEVSCYVPSETGKSFTISITDKGDDRGEDVYIAPYVDIDGVRLDCGRLQSDKNTQRKHTVVGWSNELLTSFQPFYFAALQISEDGDEHSPDSNGLGTISIKVVWMRYLDEVFDNGKKHLPTLQNSTVHEKSKKLTTHRVLLGQAVQNESRKRLLRTSNIPGFAPLNFRFHYANKDLLTARDIIPSVRPKMEAQQELTPLPRRKKRERDTEVIVIEDDDDVVTKEEKKEFERLQAKIARSQPKRVKREIKAELGLSSHKTLPGGVIDLTDD